MKIIKLFCIIALSSAFNTQGMCRPSSFLKIRKPVISNFKKILTEEERFFYRNQNELAMSNIRVNEEKEKFYKEQADFTRYKKNAFYVLSFMLIGTEIINGVIRDKDINGLPISGPVISMLQLPLWLLHSSIYKNNELAFKAYKNKISK